MRFSGHTTQIADGSAMKSWLILARNPAGVIKNQAGLLTHPIYGGLLSNFTNGVFTVNKKDLQQRVLFRTFTGFPINRVSPAPNQEQNYIKK